MNRSTPGLPVHHQLPEFTQTHVHRVPTPLSSSQFLSICSISDPAVSFDLLLSRPKGLISGYPPAPLPPLWIRDGDVSCRQQIITSIYYENHRQATSHI